VTFSSSLHRSEEWRMEGTLDCEQIFSALPIAFLVGHHH
jgi:hypothetical protein